LAVVHMRHVVQATYIQTSETMLSALRNAMTVPTNKQTHWTALNQATVGHKGSRHGSCTFWRAAAAAAGRA